MKKIYNQTKVIGGLTMLLISLLTGIVSSYVPSVIIDSSAELNYWCSLRLLCLSASLCCGFFALKNRSIIDDFLNSKKLRDIVAQELSDIRKQNNVTQINTGESHSEIMKIAVINHGDQSKKTVLFFVGMIIFFILMLYGQSKYNNEKLVAKITSEKQIAALVKSNDKLEIEIHSFDTQVKSDIDNVLAQQNSIILQLEALAKNITKIHLAFKEQQQQQSQLQSPQPETEIPTK